MNLRRATRSAPGRVARLGWAPAFVRYVRDPEASLLGKLFVLFAAAYIVLPLDAIPDVMPIVGWLDDLGVAGLAMTLLVRVLARYREPVPVSAPRR